MEIIYPGQKIQMMFSPAIKVDGRSTLLFVSATDARHSIQEKVTASSEAKIPVDAGEQAKLTMESVAAILKAGGATVQQLVQRINYIRSSASEDWSKMVKVADRYYQGHKPTSTQVRVRNLVRSELAWQLSDLVAAIENHTQGNVREEIHPENQYREEPFSHAVKVGGGADLIYVSGLSAKNNSGAPSDAGAQTCMAMDHVRRILKEAGGNIEDLVHLSVYVKSFDDEKTVRHALRDYLGGVRPAGKLAETAMEADDLLVKIEAIAAVEGSPRQLGRENIEAKGSLAKGVRVSRGKAILFMAGTVAIPIVHTHPPQPDEGSTPSDLLMQAKKTFENIETVLRLSGASFKDIFKVSRYMRNVEQIERVDEIMDGFFTGSTTAHADVGVFSLVRESFLIEISSLAMIP